MFGFFLLLAAVWLLLSGHTTVLLLACGLGSCALVAWIAHRMDVVDHEGYPVHLTRRVPGFWLWLAAEMLKSGWAVARLILGPRSGVRPAVARIPTELPSDLTRATLANAITLTPGTLSLRVHHDSIEIHTLDAAFLDDLHNGRFGRRVARLED